jgi:CBS domain-containing protein
VSNAPAVDGAALTGFLGSCVPLDTLDPADLARAVSGATVTEYDDGELILDAFASPEPELHVVWHGWVDIWTNPDRIRELADFTIGPREMFGYVAALVGEAVGPRAVAAGPAVVIRLDPHLVDPAFSTREGARMLAREVTASRRLRGDVPTYTLVDDLMVSAPLIVDPETTIGEAAVRMEAAGLPYAAVRQSDGCYGIVTDALIRRAVAESRAAGDPVGTAMRADPPTVRLGASAAEALIAVLEADTDVVLVTDRADELRGAVASRDFVVSSTTAGASLHEQIRRAETVADLEDRYHRVPGMLTGLLTRGLAPDRIITVHSALVDSLVRRAIELVLEGYPHLPPDRFTWLSLGSNGRREALLSSDIDAAVSFADDLDAEDIARYQPMFLEVTRVLERAGLAHDRHGVSPALPRFARTHTAWARASRAWLRSPDVDDAVIMVCLLVDGRPIHGDQGLPEVTRVFRDLRRHPRTMSVLLDASITQSSRSVRRRKYRVDLKRQLLLPIANIARWAALSVGSPALPTTERLLDASGSRMLSSPDATALADAFDAVQGVRLAHQIEQVATGRTPDDLVHLSELPPVDRAILAEATRVVTGIQRRMGNMARFVIP